MYDICLCIQGLSQSGCSFGCDPVHSLHATHVLEYAEIWTCVSTVTVIGKHTEIQGVKLRTRNQFFWSIAAVNINILAASDIDVSGSETQERIYIFTAVNGIQQGRIIGGSSFRTKAEIVIRIDIIVAHVVATVATEL